MADRIHLALIGAGVWGKNLARVFNQLNVLDVICDVDEKVLSGHQRRYPEAKATASFKEAISGAEINAVAIATPAELHFEQARDALLAGKRVFVEKPLAMREREGRELIDISRKVGKTLFVGHILHYHPAIQVLKRMIRDGELGKLQYIYSNRLNLGKFRREENTLWSFAPHDISLILSLAGEEPGEVQAVGSNILHPNLADSTLTNLKFPSGLGAHIFVSWLHPFKEQKLIVIGEKKMILFDDTADLNEKLIVYPHKISWEEGLPVADKKEGIPIDLSETWNEPLENECRAFLDAVSGKGSVLTDGAEGLRVLKVLDRAQKSMDGGNLEMQKNYFAHTTSLVDEDCEIGDGAKIWHFTHVLKGSKIGQNVTIGQNVMIGPNGKIGDNVKIQNNVSVYEGVVLEDDVFCGPSCVFTNVINPRAAISRKREIKKTLVRKGATIGANATIVCGVTIGKSAFIAAGSVVIEDVPDYALVAGNPAVLKGWVCECGNALDQNKKCGYCGKISSVA